MKAQRGLVENVLESDLNVARTSIQQALVAHATEDPETARIGAASLEWLIKSVEYWQGLSMRQQNMMTQKALAMSSINAPPSLMRYPSIAVVNAGEPTSR